MTPDEFRAACQIIWGDRETWGARGAAEALGINERNVKRFAAGEKLIGEGLADAVRGLLRAAISGRGDSPALRVIRESYVEAEPSGAPAGLGSASVRDAPPA